MADRSGKATAKPPGASAGGAAAYYKSKIIRERGGTGAVNDAGSTSHACASPERHPAQAQQPSGSGTGSS